jgi:hypothetical protein
MSGSEWGLAAKNGRTVVAKNREARGENNAGTSSTLVPACYVFVEG